MLRTNADVLERLLCLRHYVIPVDARRAGSRWDHRLYYTLMSGWDCTFKGDTDKRYLYLLLQLQKLDEVIDLVADLEAGHALQPRVELDVLSDREVREQHVVLRADADGLARLLRLRHYVVPVDARRAGRRWDHTFEKGLNLVSYTPDRTN